MPHTAEAPSALFPACSDSTHTATAKRYRLRISGPGSVMRGKASAEPDRRMRAGPEFDQWRWGGVIQALPTQEIESGLPGCLRIGHDAVNNLLPEAVGSMLLRACIGG